MRTLQITFVVFFWFSASSVFAQETSVQPTCGFSSGAVTTKVELSEPLRSTDKIRIQCNDDQVRVRVVRAEKASERIVDLDAQTTDAPRIVAAVVVELLRKSASTQDLEPDPEPEPQKPVSKRLLEAGLFLRTLRGFSTPVFGTDLSILSCAECFFFFGGTLDVALGRFDRDPGSLGALVFSVKPTIGIRSSRSTIDLEARLSPIVGWVRVSPDSIPGETSDASFFWRAISASVHAAYKVSDRSRISGFLELGATVFPLTAVNESGENLDVKGVFLSTGIRYGFAF